MKNSIDFRKINHGLYGVINLNNMIPVLEDELIQIDIENIPDPKYKRLLQNQYFSILSDITQIQKKATNLHTLIFTPDKLLNSHAISVKKRCCNLPLLESIYKNYKH